MATSLSEPTKKRILQVCVKLFLEQGYKKTTMAEIIEKSGVSSSSFQNIFRAKDVRLPVGQVMEKQRALMGEYKIGRAHV